MMWLRRPTTMVEIAGVKHFEKGAMSSVGIEVDTHFS